MTGLSEQPMASGTVTTNGVATSKEDVARGHSRAYGNFVLGGPGVITLFFYGVVCLAFASWVASGIDGWLKGVVFVSAALVLPVLFLLVRRLMKKRASEIAEWTWARETEASEAARHEDMTSKIEAAKASGAFDRFGP